MLVALLALVFISLLCRAARPGFGGQWPDTEQVERQAEWHVIGVQILKFRPKTRSLAPGSRAVKSNKSCGHNAGSNIFVGLRETPSSPKIPGRRPGLPDLAEKDPANRGYLAEAAAGGHPLRRIGQIWR
jgi:hypothetical protein